MLLIYKSEYIKGSQNSITAKWVSARISTHWFENLDKSKLWTEYRNGIKRFEYRFYKMSDEELTLKNIHTNQTFVKIHKDKVVYLNGPRARPLTMIGEWEKMPLFPDRIIFFLF